MARFGYWESCPGCGRMIRMNAARAQTCRCGQVVLPCNSCKHDDCQTCPYSRTRTVEVRDVSIQNA